MATDVYVQFDSILSAANSPDVTQQEALGIALEKLRSVPAWSWYEPDPVALLETDIQRQHIHPLLRPGKPFLPDGMVFETLMLFGNREGVVLRQTADGLRAVHWYKSPGTSGVNVRSLRRCSEPVLMRDDGVLATQFGLPERKRSRFANPQRLFLVTYRDGVDILAWTLRRQPIS